LAVDQLVESKILQERTGYARNRVFAAPNALSIINRPFGEDPILPDPHSGNSSMDEADRPMAL
jgi:hypothetical protein